MTLFDSPISSARPQLDMRAILRLVYAWMGIGLVTTAGVAVFTANWISQQSPRWWAQNQGLFIGLLIGQLVLVIALSALQSRLSPMAAGVMFIVYSVMTGLTFSVLFFVYSLGTISMAFFATAGTFAAMSVLGFTTQLDLSKYRTYLFMGLIGLLVANVIFLFFRSSVLDLVISLFGVVLFTVLTAYDTQKIKRMAEESANSGDSASTQKLAIFGALTLYLDFINLFLYLLRLFGNRR